MSAEYVLNDNGKPRILATPFVDDAANQAWTKATRDSSRALILYVHGRDRKFSGGDGEPESSFKEGIVGELERHETTVAMVHWPHFSLSPLGYPDDAAFAAAPALILLLAAIRKYRPQRSTTPVILLTHSMGSLVVQRAAGEAPPELWHLMRHAVISSCASKVQGSSSWIRALGVPAYVTMNPDDKALGYISSANGPFLGRQSAQSIPPEELAPNATYFDLGPLKVSHRYFVLAKSGGNVIDLEFLRDRLFHPLYTGEIPDVAQFERPDPTRKIYRISR